MKKNVADKWVAALRSGKYRQGRGRLYDGERFCAIGVLHELFRRDQKISKKEFWSDPSDSDAAWFVSHWAGCRADFAYAPNRFISVDNDRGAEFEVIANIIEENYEKL